ncbi:MAG TPA: phage holin family protein [Capillimicrobium sp.]|nr:phage holin family protein [Capillimicrobium sp.]
MLVAEAPETVGWRPARPRLRPLRLLAAWLASALALLLAAAAVPGATLGGFGGAVVVAAVIGVLNAILPPLLAALRLPFTVAAGFLLVLTLDAAMVLAAAELVPEHLDVDGFGAALAVALVAAGVSAGVAVVAGIDDDDAYMLRVARRVARRVGTPMRTDAPGILFLEIDGLALPVLRRAIQDGTTPNMARWLADGTHRLLGWETDLSSQTGASQAGILLGDNDDIPAFRWVDKGARTLVACSSPDDCAAIERRHATGAGLLAGGGTSRGNLLSGEAAEAILTVSRLADERAPNPGYRAFLANGFNVTRTLVLMAWEVAIELVAATAQRRRDVRPRGARGGRYPLLRAGMCVFVRDLIVFSVLQDMFRGVPAVYATFASYDEVAHHSGLERGDTLAALRKLDQRFGMLERARRYAPRPYEIVVLSDHGQTQGATFRQRNGYGLDDLVERHLSTGRADGLAAGDENATGVQRAVDEATGRTKADGSPDRGGALDREAVVLGSGNLGLVYLMASPRRLSLEEIRALHPGLVEALSRHPHVGFVLVRSAEHGAVAIGAHGVRRLVDGHVDGEDPLAAFPPNAARHLLRTDGFRHVADLMVNSFFDAVTEEACAFEELISVHGGLGGPQTQPFVLHPARLEPPAEPLVGAVAVHRMLRSWRMACNHGPGANGARAGTAQREQARRAVGA